MSKNNDLRPWDGRTIAHVALSVSGKKFEPHHQPTREYDPDEMVSFVVTGYIDAKVGYERTEGGLWVRTGSATLTEAYELEEDVARPLLDEGKAGVAEVLRRRMGIVDAA